MIFSFNLQCVTKKWNIFYDECYDARVKMENIDSNELIFQVLICFPFLI